jgi:ribosome assembly protein YihI (activator of Der GTPase)
MPKFLPESRTGHTIGGREKSDAVGRGRRRQKLRKGRADDNKTAGVHNEKLRQYLQQYAGIMPQLTIR